MSGILAAWREVKGIVAGLAVTSLGLALLKKYKAALLSIGLLSAIFYFFRDPERVPAAFADDLLLAPADGKVTAIEVVDEPHFFKGPARRITLFLSLVDVHVQRSPYQGQVRFLRYQSGSFVPAFFKDTSQNEYNLIGLLTPRGPIAVKQIAGILARRIVCWPQLDDQLVAGERLGLIKFGSRVDLLLPLEVEVLVHSGEQLYGGQTIVARWPA